MVPLIILNHIPLTFEYEKNKAFLVISAHFFGEVFLQRVFFYKVNNFGGNKSRGRPFTEVHQIYHKLSQFRENKSEKVFPIRLTNYLHEDCT